MSYTLDMQGIVSFPSGQAIYRILLVNPPDLFWVPTSLQLSGYRAAFSPRQKRQGLEGKHTHIVTSLEMSGVVPHYFSHFATCQVLKMFRQCTTSH